MINIRVLQRMISAANKHAINIYNIEFFEGSNERHI